MAHDCESPCDRSISSRCLNNFISQAITLFNPLRPAETFVIENVALGQKASLHSTSHADRTMRSEVLRWLINKVNATPHLRNSGVQIGGVTFYNGVTLTNMSFTIPLCLTSCYINGELDLRNTHAGQLDFEGSQVTSVIRASNLQVAGDFCLNGAFEARHGIYMTNTKISGNFDCRGARFGAVRRDDFKRFDDHPFDDRIPSNAPDLGMPSIVANGLETGGSVLLSGIKPTHTDKRLGADIIRLDAACMDETRDCPSKCPLMKCLGQERASIRNVWLSGLPFEADGPVYLMSAKINGLVRLSCARICSHGVYALRADAVKTGGSIIFHGVDVTGQLRLVNASVGNRLEFCGGVFRGPEDDIIKVVKEPFKKAAIYMDEIHIGTDLLITRIFRCSRELRMMGAHISGNMVIDNAEIDAISAQCAEISGDARFGLVEKEGEPKDKGETEGRHFYVRHSIDMMNVSIGKDIALGKGLYGSDYPLSIYSDSKKVQDSIMLNAAKVGGSICAKPGCVICGTADLKDANIGGNLRLSGTVLLSGGVLKAPDSWLRCTDSEMVALNADRVNVAGNVFLSEGFKAEGGSVRLPGASIGGGLFMNDDTGFREVDLTSAKITKELHLGSFPKNDEPRWVGKSRMVLHNTSVEAIQDADDPDAGDTKSWPEALELEGFSCQRLAGTNTAADADVADIATQKRCKSATWFINWLNRDKTYSPQPYEYLAGLLKDSGYTREANAVLYESRKRSRARAWKRHEWLRWIGMSLLQWTIGYGLGARYFWVLLWFLGITLIGFVVLLVSIDEAKLNFFKMAWASFDLVLPFVKLDDNERLISETNNNWTIAYFYVQQLVGYVLGGFLAAGLAGLTQKK